MSSHKPGSMQMRVADDAWRPSRCRPSSCSAMAFAVWTQRMNGLQKMAVGWCTGSRP
jgi:hypothetical protein